MIKQSPNSKQPATISPNTALKTLPMTPPPTHPRPRKTLLIQEHLREIIKLFKFNIFKPSVQKFWVTIERLTYDTWISK